MICKVAQFRDKSAVLEHCPFFPIPGAFFGVHRPTLRSLGGTTGITVAVVVVAVDGAVVGVVVGVVVVLVVVVVSGVVVGVVVVVAEVVIVLSLVVLGRSVVVVDPSVEVVVEGSVVVVELSVAFFVDVVECKEALVEAEVFSILPVLDFRSEVVVLPVEVSDSFSSSDVTLPTLEPSVIVEFSALSSSPVPTLFLSRGAVPQLKSSSSPKSEARLFWKYRYW